MLHLFLKLIKSKKGTVSLALTVVLFMSSLALALSVSWTGIGEMVLAYGTTRGEQAFELADSCVAEGLLRLKRDNGYAGGTLSVGTNSCTLVVSGTLPSKTIVATATVGQVVREITVSVTVSGFTTTVTNWVES